MLPISTYANASTTAQCAFTGDAIGGCRARQWPAPGVTRRGLALAELLDLRNEGHQQQQPRCPQRGPCHRLPREAVRMRRRLAAKLVLDFPVPLPDDAFAVALAHGPLDPPALRRRRGHFAARPL